MLVLLAQLAYSLISWTQNLLAAASRTLRKFGILRMVRDVFHIPGHVKLDSQGRIIRITLNRKHPFAVPVVQALSSHLARDDMSLILGQIYVSR